MSSIAFKVMCLVVSWHSILYYQRYDPLLVLLLSSHHSVAFACSCLSVCKYAHIVAFKGMKQHLLADVLVHLHLGRIVDVLRLQIWRERSGSTKKKKVRRDRKSSFLNNLTEINWPKKKFGHQKHIGCSSKHIFTPCSWIKTNQISISPQLWLRITNLTNSTCI